MPDQKVLSDSPSELSQPDMRDGSDAPDSHVTIELSIYAQVSDTTIITQVINS